MATQIELVNRILRRMREDEVTSITENDYSQLVADMVADAYEEVAQEYDWRSIQHTVTFDTIASDSRYDLSNFITGTGDVKTTASRLAKTDSYLVYNDTEPFVYIDGENIAETTQEAMLALRAKENGTAAGLTTGEWPSIFALQVNSANTELRMFLWPAPTEVKTVSVRLVTQPDRLESDGTTDDEVIITPERPVYQLALAYALNERGEEMGEPGNVAEQRYQRSLEAAIEAELKNYERNNSREWRRD